jgi:hypothetical protein
MTMIILILAAFNVVVILFTTDIEKLRREQSKHPLMRKY